MLLLVSLCRLGIQIPFPMGSEQTQTVLGAKQTQWVWFISLLVPLETDPRTAGSLHPFVVSVLY